MGKAALLLAIWVSAAVAAPAQARAPVLLELYTAQGCSSCVKADQVLAALGDKPPVLILTFGVDYWDYLGWRDTFAKPEFTARQRSYMAKLNLNEVYTPQVVVDGRLETAAVPDGKIAPLVKAAAREQHAGPKIQYRKDKVVIGASATPPGRCGVWLVRYQPHDQSVTVRSGENNGQTVTEQNVVRELVRLGSWSGRSRTFALPPPTEEGLATVVLIQVGDGGRIFSVG